MKVILGLGNIGKKYIYTRHNIGFLILDEYAKENNLLFKAGKGEFFFANKMNCSL